LNNVPPEDAVEFLKRQLERYLRQKTKANTGSASTWQQVIENIAVLRVPALDVAPALSPGVDFQAPIETTTSRTSTEQIGANDGDCTRIAAALMPVTLQNTENTQNASVFKNRVDIRSEAANCSNWT
jgi:hypothetical protein